MTPRAVEFHPRAVEKARAARQWYAERSMTAAGGFASELDAAVERISSAPMLCPPYLFGTRRYLLKRFPYLVVFRQIDDKIQVVAVAHGRRKPGYWRERMRGDMGTN